MRIKVTQKDIENGIRFEPDSCPLALALRRRFKTSNVEVGQSDDVELSKDSVKYQVVFGDLDRVDDFITDFDRGYEVSPFAVDVTLLPISDGA